MHSVTAVSRPRTQVVVGVDSLLGIVTTNVHIWWDQQIWYCCNLLILSTSRKTMRLVRQAVSFSLTKYGLFLKIFMSQAGQTNSVATNNNTASYTDVRSPF